MRLISAICILVLFSCKKEPIPTSFVEVELHNGMIVLNEGLFQQNNSTTSWISFHDETITNSIFSLFNGRGLGDTGNDIQQYGSKVYIVMNVSSTIEVLDAKTFKSIKQISMQDGSTAKQPRSIRFYDGYGYVACYDGYVDVIDTTQLTVVNRIPVGLNPESIAFANNKMYVSNSGGLNAPQMDSTVSVVDLISHTELTKITVGLNPGDILEDTNGNMFVISRGNYGTIPSRMVKINGQTDNVENVYGFDASSIAKYGTKFLVTYYNFSNGSSSIGLFNPMTGTMENSAFINTAIIETPYGVTVDDNNQKIYVTDAMNYTNSGFVHVFDYNGSFLRSYNVGLNPSKILLYE